MQFQKKQNNTKNIFLYENYAKKEKIKQDVIKVFYIGSSNPWDWIINRLYLKLQELRFLYF